MNGATLCPHCETRFKISDAQLSAHQGMVRCGHCLQVFDARPNFVPEQPGPQLDLPIDDVAEQAEATPVAEHTDPELAAFPADEVSVRPDDTVAEQTARPEYDAVIAEPTSPERDDTLDFSHTTVSVDTQADLADIIHADRMTFKESLPQTLAEQVVVVRDDVEDTPPVSPEKRAWPWAIAALVLVVLLMAQAAYFFRVSLAAHLPTLKPTLTGYCQLLNCSVPLPQNTELMGIESSSLAAEPEQENQILFNALLRNRASYTLAFPMLELTLNDNQDKPLARRLFLPSEYLPTGESEQTGFPKNHEVSIKLRMNTTDLRPAGYRLELLYPQ